MDLEWIFNESMNLEWIFNGTSMDLQWIFNGSSMDLQWILRCAPYEQRHGHRSGAFSLGPPGVCFVSCIDGKGILRCPVVIVCHFQ